MLPVKTLEKNLSLPPIASGICRQSLVLFVFVFVFFNFPTVLLFDLEIHYSNLCLHLHIVFSPVYLCVCVQIFLIL